MKISILTIPDGANTNPHTVSHSPGSLKRPL